MQCSKCSEVIKPIVAIDIDGTLADYHTHLQRFCVNYWNLPFHINNAPMTWKGEGNFEDYLGITQAQYREAKLAFRQGGMKRTMPLYPGDSPDMWTSQLRALGAEVWLTTTRPWQRLDNVDPDTRFWLAKHRVEYDHLLFDEFKYERLAQQVDPGRVLMVVDDLSEMCQQAEEQGLYVVQVSRQHNWADWHTVRMAMPGIVRRSKELIKEWSNNV